VQAFGEARNGHIGLGLRDFVVTSVEVEGFHGELGTFLVPVSDLRTGSPEGNQTFHGG
jgi:hypothetical protein